MPLKQSSFNFDFTPGEDLPEESPVVQEPKASVPLEETPVVVEIEEAVFVQTSPNPVHGPLKPPTQVMEEFKKPARGRMKLSEMNAVLDQVNVPEDAVLFTKQYYSIGAVAEMFKVNQSLIRHWENEFDILKPKKNGKGDRFFRPEDVKNLKLIYQLLRERKYTIEGAKEFLKKNKNAEEKFAIVESLKKLKSFLNELKANL